MMNQHDPAPSSPPGATGSPGTAPSPISGSGTPRGGTRDSRDPGTPIYERLVDEFRARQSPPAHRATATRLPSSSAADSITTRTDHWPSSGDNPDRPHTPLLPGDPATDIAETTHPHSPNI